MEDEKNISITVLVAAGRLPLEIMAAAHRLAVQHGFGIYLSTAQNLRLNDVPESVAGEVKNTLAALGAEFKAPGKLLMPRVCVGQGYCKLGVVDIQALNRKILDVFADRKTFKAKVKLAISGCTMCCSNTKLSDIGIMATRNGYDVFVGGKGGPFPKVGRRIEKSVSEERVLEVVSDLIDFHDKKTANKQRMHKLISDPEFPYAEV